MTISVTDTATDDDASSVSSRMTNSSYTKVVVVGGTINDKFAQSIFYTQYGVNDKVTSLDFSQTSYISDTFEKSFFNHPNVDNSWRKAQLNITSLSLPGNITKIGDESVQLTKLTDVVMPDAVTYIGKKAFVGTILTSITFPANLDKIDDAAFFNVKIKDLKFNSKLRYIGNSAFAWDNVNEANGEKVLGAIIIPASVKYIGPAAFFNHQYQDVYFQGGVAPVMPYGSPVVSVSIGNVVECTAFSAHTLMLNNGFNPSSKTTTGGTSDNTETGYANRENYIDNNGAYMAILHYPNTVTNTDSLKTFTDITRKYEADTAEVFNKNHNYVVGKETTPLTAFGVSTSGNVNVGYKDTYLGEQFIWPSQNQWMRSYITAVNGVEWDGLTSYRSTLQDWEKAVLAEAGYTTDNYTEDALSKMAHQGTRMFVLANNDAQSEKYNPGNIKKDGTWWTICVPFNMTKKQVLETFGDKTQLCLFHSVTRQIEVNGKNHILIRFDIDPMKYKTADANGKKLKYDGTDGTHAAGEWKYDEIASDEINSDNVGDNDIAIWAHESYMIKPSDGENSDQDPVTIANYEPVPGNPLPSVVRAETVYMTQDASYDNLYRFVGNYESGMTMPQYSYFYGTTKNDKTEKFRFNTGTTTVWKANKSLIQASAHDGGFQDFQNFFGGSAESAAKVKQTTVFGGIDDPNGDTTAIDDVQIVIGNDTLTPIFSLDGKMVSVNGDTTGLAKGIYVKAGKKFIVE